MTERKTAPRHARRRLARLLLLSLGPEPGRRQGGAGRGAAAVAGRAALARRRGAGLAWARWRGIALFARDGTLGGGLLAGLLFAPSSAASSSACSSRPHRAWSCSSTSRRSSSPSACRSSRAPSGLSARADGRPGDSRSPASRGRSPRASRRPAAGPRQWLGDGARRARRRALGRDDAGDPRDAALASASAEKTLLYQLGVSGARSRRGGSRRRPAAGRRRCRRWPGLAFFQIVIVTFASYLLWFWLIRHYPATRLASFTLLTPVFGLLLGALLLGEPVTARLRGRAAGRRGRHLPRQPAMMASVCAPRLAHRAVLAGSRGWPGNPAAGSASSPASRCTASRSPIRCSSSRAPCATSCALRSGGRLEGPPLRVPGHRPCRCSRTTPSGAGCAWPTCGDASATRPATGRSRSATPAGVAA